MLQVEFSQLAASPTSLIIGCVVRYGSGGPVRFAQLVVKDDALDWEALTDVANWLVRQTNRHLDRERQAHDDHLQQQLPL